MRIFGAILIVLGFLLSMSIIGAIFGIPLMLIGLILVIFGGRRRTVITNIVQVSTAPNSNLSYDSESSSRKSAEPRREPIQDGPRLSISSRSQGADLRRRSEREFTDIENEMSKRSMDILYDAKADGFDVQYMRAQNKVVVSRSDIRPISLYSNEEISGFGRRYRYGDHEN